MGIDFGSVFNNFPPWLAVFSIATLPIAELRAAIPVGIEYFELSWPIAVFWSILGNILPVIILVWFLEPVAKWLSANSDIMRRFFGWLFERTRRKNDKNFQRWGALALVTFVAIPLPVTGGWTGAVASFVFGVPRRRAVGLISVGVLIAAIIVTITTLGISSII